MDKQLEELLTLSKGLNVLYVEDDDLLRNNTCQLLEEFFGSIKTAEDGQAGLEAYEQGNYDIVVSDLRMPRMDGVAMVTAIKQQNPNQMVLITSAHDESVFLLKLINLGVEYFLLKPLDFTLFMRVLHKMLRAIQLERLDRDYKQELEKQVAERTSEVNLAYQRLSQVDAVKKTMLSLLAHETRTPLNWIMAPAEMLSESTNLDDDQKELVKIIGNSAESLLKLSERTSFLCKLLDRQEAHKSTGNLQDQMSLAVQRWQTRASQAEVSLCVKSTTGPELEAEWGLIAMVMDGLLENAISAGPKKSEISLNVRVEPTSAVVEVTDQGKGIDPDWLERIFDVFVVEKIMEHQKGFGLGLAIARAILNLHSGEIKAENLASGGSRFTFSLPLFTEVNPGEM